MFEWKTGSSLPSYTMIFRDIIRTMLQNDKPEGTLCLWREITMGIKQTACSSSVQTI